MIANTLQHYTITAKIGEGGMGEVYRAEDSKLGREVAIKVLPADMANDPERLRRFDQEARAASARRLSSPRPLPRPAIGFRMMKARFTEAPGSDASVPFNQDQLADRRLMSVALCRGVSI